MALAPGTYAVFTTTEGKITVRLFEADAPITVKNFIELAEGAKEWTHPTTRNKSTDKLFDGTIFHRVIPDFMIQGGDPAGTGMGGPGYRFAGRDQRLAAQVRQARQAGHGQHRPRNQRLPVLHHRRPHALAHRQPHHLRRSRRGPGDRQQNLPGAPRRPGQAQDPRRARIRRHRTYWLIQSLSFCRRGDKQFWHHCAATEIAESRSSATRRADRRSLGDFWTKPVPRRTEMTIVLYFVHFAIDF